MTHLLAEGGYQIFTLHNSEKTWLYFALVCAVASIVVALLLVRGVLAADQGTATMKDIAKAIQEGAEASQGDGVLDCGGSRSLHRAYERF